MRGLLFLASKSPRGQLILGIIFLALGLYCLLTLLFAPLMHQTVSDNDLHIGLIMGIAFTLLGCYSLTMSFFFFRKIRRAKAASASSQPVDEALQRR